MYAFPPLSCVSEEDLLIWGLHFQSCLSWGVQQLHFQNLQGWLTTAVALLPLPRKWAVRVLSSLIIMFLWVIWTFFLVLQVLLLYERLLFAPCQKCKHCQINRNAFKHQLCKGKRENGISGIFYKSFRHELTHFWHLGHLAQITFAQRESSWGPGERLNGNLVLLVKEATFLLMPYLWGESCRWISWYYYAAYASLVRKSFKKTILKLEKCNENRATFVSLQEGCVIFLLDLSQNRIDFHCIETLFDSSWAHFFVVWSAYM